MSGFGVGERPAGFGEQGTSMKKKRFKGLAGILWLFIGLAAGETTFRLESMPWPGENGEYPTAGLLGADLPVEISIILGRPTDRSITASVLADRSIDGFLEYGPTSGGYLFNTAPVPIPAGSPVEIEIGELSPDTKYYYRLRYRPSDGAGFSAANEHSFRTQRASGKTFSFAIQADSHPERVKSMFDPDLYVRTLQLIAADQPDFFLTLGDDFSIDTLKVLNPDTVGGIYSEQRRFLGTIGPSTPIFLVNGNHEQGAAYLLDGTPDNAAVWVQNARNRNFPQPAPDRFYSGDEQPVEFIGLLRDYYAWTWGDALFVVIDPYWHSPIAVDGENASGDKKKDKWDITLGGDQYRWFKDTLEGSAAKYKFVFAHHVQGTGRGGIELADLYEWGGYNDKGVWEFNTKRPGWELPIHPLMAKNKVTIFFQGHDHLFAKQERDGVIYQECPIPADYTYSAFNEDAYPSGVKLPNAGYLRVTVSEADVKVEYVRSFLPADESAGQRPGQVAYTYSTALRNKNGRIRRFP
jgi:hypothetical protein